MTLVRDRECNRPREAPDRTRTLGCFHALESHLLARTIAAAALAVAFAACGSQNGPIGEEPRPPAGGGLLRGSFSPDGAKIAYIGLTDGFSRLGVGTASDGGPLWITPTDRNATDFAWLSDSSRLLVADQPHVDDPLGPDAPTEDRLTVIEASGEHVRTIETSRSLLIDGAGMSVSPDGRYAVVAASAPGIVPGPTDLFRVELSSGATIRLLRTPNMDEGHPRFMGEDALVFTSVPQKGPRRSSVATLDLARGTTEVLSPRDHYAEAADASTDLVLYAGSDESSAEQGLWDVRPGGKSRLVLRGSFGFPSLSPNGKDVLVSVYGAPASPGHLEVHELQFK